MIVCECAWSRIKSTMLRHALCPAAECGSRRHPEVDDTGIRKPAKTPTQLYLVHSSAPFYSITATQLPKERWAHKKCIEYKQVHLNVKRRTKISFLIHSSKNIYTVVLLL